MTAAAPARDRLRYLTDEEFALVERVVRRALAMPKAFPKSDLYWPPYLRDLRHRLALMGRIAGFSQHDIDEMALLDKHLDALDAAREARS